MSKVTVVGAGNVGATCANVLAHKDLVKEVVLLDLKGDLAKGKALDSWQQASIDYYSTKLKGTDDYKDTANRESAFSMQSELGIMKLSIPVAYTNGDFTVAVAPVLQYSTLQMNYESLDGFSNNKSDSSVGLGMTAGLAYDMGDLTLGAMYKSKIEATYKDNISNGMSDFNLNNGAGLSSGDQLDQPAEIGIGVAYDIGKSTLAMDINRVQW